MTKEDKKSNGMLGRIIQFIIKKKLSIPITIGIGASSGAAGTYAIMDVEPPPPIVVEQDMGQPDMGPPDMGPPPNKIVPRGPKLEAGGEFTLPGLSMVWDFEYKGTMYRCFRWHGIHNQQGSLSCSVLP